MELIAKVPDSPELARRQSDALAALNAVGEVDCDASAEAAAEAVKGARAWLRDVEAYRKGWTSRLDAAKKAAMDAQRRFTLPVEEASARVQARLTAYAGAREREREAARAAASRAEDEALAALAAGETPPVSQARVEVPAPMRVRGVSAARKAEFQVLDPNRVPRELCSPDAAKIRAFLNASVKMGNDPDTIRVDGLRVWGETKAVVR